MIYEGWMIHHHVICLRSLTLHYLALEVSLNTQYWCIIVNIPVLRIDLILMRIRTLDPSWKKMNPHWKKSCPFKFTEFKFFLTKQNCQKVFRFGKFRDKFFFCSFWFIFYFAPWICIFLRIRIREGQKLADPIYPDLDPKHWSKLRTHVFTAFVL